MTDPELDRNALAAGFVTQTLSDTELTEAEALLASDPHFANLVTLFRKVYEAEGEDPLPDRVWNAIERDLTERQN